MDEVESRKEVIDSNEETKDKKTRRNKSYTDIVQPMTSYVGLVQTALYQ